MKANAPLKVTLHGMDERAMQMFGMFLAGPARGCCEIVPEGQQEAAVVDLDGVGAERLWLDVRRRFAGPALVLSVREKQLRHSIWVSKPVQSSEFISAVARVRTELNTLETLHEAEAKSERLMAAPAPIPVTSPVAPPSPPPAASVQESAGGTTSRAADLALQERRVHECCGDLDNTLYLDPARRAELFFDPSETLLGAMREAVQLARKTGTPAVVDGIGHPLVLCPDQRRLYTDMREQYLRPLCVRTRTQTPMTIRTIPLEETPVTTSTDPRLTRLDAMLWNVALWTARGRVPRGTSLDAPVSLRAWPNLSRLQVIPGAMQIAALWVARPTSLMQTAERLAIPYRYVFSFFTACQALDLIEQAAGGVEPVATPAPSVEQVSAPAKAERRGLFSRMLNKLGLG